MIELLKRLAAAEPELCHEETSGGAITYFRFGEAVLGIMEQRLIVHLPPDGQVIGDDVALFWLQGILQQAIERRGWPYVISYNGDDHHARVGNYPAVSVDGFTNAAKAILAAYVEAVEGEEQ